MRKIVLLLFVTSVLSLKEFELEIFQEIYDGLNRNLDYLKENYEKINADCLLGVAMAIAFTNDVYRKGENPVDKKLLVLLSKADSIYENIKPTIESNPDQFWIGKYITDWHIWDKNIQYKDNQLYSYAYSPNKQLVDAIFKRLEPSYDFPPSDFCLMDIVNSTSEGVYKTCYFNKKCQEKYVVDTSSGSGYLLTHKLLMLQLARARKCIINKKAYLFKSKELCSHIFAETVSSDYYGHLGDMLDLFMEQIVLCGYEGYTEFFRTKWAKFILDSQKSSGCFSVTDSEARLKRNINKWSDGCSDHTTGLGTAVLALHLNYLIKNYPLFVNYQ